MNIYYLIKNKLLLIVLLASLSIVFGIIGFDGKGFYPTVMGVLDFFTFNSIQEYNLFTFLSRIFAILTLTFGALAFFLHRTSNHLVLSSLYKKPYSLVVGLGENCRFYLDNEVGKDEQIVIVEKNRDNPYIDHYMSRGFGVQIGDILDDEVLKKLSLSNVKQSIISTGDDKRNLEILLKLTKYFDENRHKRVYLHLEDMSFNSLFVADVIDTSSVDIVPFSFYELAVRMLFIKHSILGDKSQIIQTKEPFFIAIVGSGELALEVLYQLCNLAHLPNENELVIYCVDVNADKFIKEVKNNFTNIDKISNIKLTPINLDFKTEEFYLHDIWREKNLTNIIIADKDEQNNLKIALGFSDTCYGPEIFADTLKTKVLFASYDQNGLSNSINSNDKKFRQFFAFADAKSIFHKDNFLNEKIDSIAKLIHYKYGNKYDANILFTKDNEKIDEKWFRTSTPNDKISSKMQAMHIDTKLLSLGLKKQISDKPDKELLKINREIFNKKLGVREIDDKKLLEYSKELEKLYSDKEFEIMYFPQKYESLFEKLIRSEHNRWSSYHYLNGWKYNTIKNKAIKEHNCLLPFSKFEDPKIRILIIYDIYSVVLIPNLLASSGVLLVEMD